MKNYLTLSNALSLLLVGIFSVLFISCSSSDDDDVKAISDEIHAASMNIVETAIADGRFTTLVAALQAADLADDLQADGPFTVFAPTDDAFEALPEGTVASLLEAANQNTLIDILTYHVYAGEVLADDAIALSGSSVPMLNTVNLNIDVESGSVILNMDGNRTAIVTITDIIATNGVIHVIDTVLDPDDGRKDIVETAIAAGTFNTLVAALQAADLDDDLSGEGPFTVFAPTDDAFNLLPEGTVAFLLEPANQALLTDILTYHVIAAKVLAADAIALDGSSATALNNSDISVDIVNGAVVLNMGGNRSATVTATDIIAKNGVIHVIDMVLDPDDAPQI